MNKPPITLLVQLFFFIILPLTGLLLLFSFGSVMVHQNEMRTMLGERDRLTLSAAARSVESSLEQYQSNLQLLVLRAMADQESVKAVVDNSSNLTSAFDLGFTLINGGQIALQQSWEKQLPVLTEKPQENITLYILEDGRAALILAWSSEDGLWAGFGALNLSSLLEKTFAQMLPADPGIRVFIVDSSHQVLYQSNALYFDGQPALHPGVEDALQGRSGTLYMQSGQDEHLVAYAPLAGWALVLEEPWQAAVSPLLNASQVAPLLMVPLLLIVLVTLWFGVSQIAQPLQKLEKQAAKLAEGDFSSVNTPVQGIAEIRQLQAGMSGMARKLESTQKSLQNYIGSITSAQEDERRRLARDLHDDTLQGMIVLKQRLQLARGGKGNKSLGEVIAYTEETIQNLRRTMRALRPIYLEDLGLSPALDVLTKQSAQPPPEVTFVSNGQSRRLKAESELALYRIAQEALNNALKHANARSVVIRLTFEAQQVILEVKDDGVGFSYPASPNGFVTKGHFGLLGLRERANLIHANLQVLTSLGEGTCIRVILDE